MTTRTHSSTLARWTAVLLAGVLGACAQWFTPTSIDVSQARLLAALSQRFPRDMAVLPGLSLVATQPRLSMLPDQNRVLTEIDLGLSGPLAGAARTLTMATSFGLRFDATDQTVRMVAPRVQQLRMGGREADLSAMVPQAIARAVERWADDAVLHRLDAGELERLSRQGVRPGALQVRPDGLRIELQRTPADEAPRPG